MQRQTLLRRARHSAAWRWPEGRRDSFKHESYPCRTDPRQSSSHRGHPQISLHSAMGTRLQNLLWQGAVYHLGRSMGTEGVRARLPRPRHQVPVAAASPAPTPPLRALRHLRCRTARSSPVADAAGPAATPAHHERPCPVERQCSCCIPSTIRGTASLAMFCLDGELADRLASTADADA